MKPSNRLIKNIIWPAAGENTGTLTLGKEVAEKAKRRACCAELTLPS
jgi:hypothetical protein